VTVTVTVKSRSRSIPDLHADVRIGTIQLIERSDPDEQHQVRMRLLNREELPLEWCCWCRLLLIELPCYQGSPRAPFLPCHECRVSTQSKPLHGLTKRELRCPLRNHRFFSVFGSKSVSTETFEVSDNKMRSICTRLRAQTYTSVWNLVCTRHRHAGWLNELTNYEKEGIPDGKAAVDSNHGWDLVRGLSLVALSVCVCVCLCVSVSVCDTRHRQGRRRRGRQLEGRRWWVAPYYLDAHGLTRSRSFTPSGRM